MSASKLTPTQRWALVELRIVYFFVRLWYRRFTHRQTLRVHFGSAYPSSKNVRSLEHYPYTPGETATLNNGSMLYLGNMRWLVL